MKTHQYLHHPLSGAPRPHIHIIVIGVAHDVVPRVALTPDPRRPRARSPRAATRAPLRRSLVPLHHYPVRHHSSFQVAVDESEHPTVRDLVGQLPEGHVVIDAIEKCRQIDVYIQRTVGIPSCRPRSVQGELERRVRHLARGPSERHGRRTLFAVRPLAAQGRPRSYHGLG